MAAPLEFLATVKPEWIDHNGHMNVAYFVLAFDQATDAAYERWGLGLDFPDEHGCSVYTLGMNVDYHRELFVGDALQIVTRLVDVDHKRIHYFHEMFRAESGDLAATNECLCMNVDLESRRGAPFPAAIMEKLVAAQDAGDVPAGFGRVLGIRRR